MSLPLRALECTICLEVLSNAVYCVNCHVPLCESHVAELRECPVCKAAPFKTVVDFGLRRVMEDLLFACQFCKSPIRKGSLHVHETNCQNLQRHRAVPENYMDDTESGTKALVALWIWITYNHTKCVYKFILLCLNGFLIYTLHTSISCKFFHYCTA